MSVWWEPWSVGYLGLCSSGLLYLKVWHKVEMLELVFSLVWNLQCWVKDAPLQTGEQEGYFVLVTLLVAKSLAGMRWEKK